tara:strand:- start:221 stop:403 length:183 start_codon:yes stop_codon:yes gene_type:complete
MPKKRLTKAQVKRIMRSMVDMANKLTRDKLDHRSKSFVPMSFNAIFDIGTKLFNARNRIE